MPWYDGLETADVGRIQNSGWDKLEPDAAAKAIYSSYRAAESKLGLPADRVLRLPETTDTAGWDGVYKTLGKPETPDKYEFGDVKFGDGSALSPEFATTLKTLAHQLNLPATQAPNLAKAIIGQFEANAAAAKTRADAEAMTAQTNKLATELQTKSSNTAALQAAWQGEYDKNYQAAQRVALQLGYSADELVEMSGGPKYKPFMERMFAMAKGAGELGMVGHQGGSGFGEQNGGRTEEQLTARRQEILEGVRGKMLTPDKSQEVFKEMAEIDRQLVIARHSRR